MTEAPSGWVEAEVQIQGDSLVVKDRESGDCVVVEARKLFDHYDPHDDPNMPYDRLESIFGEDVYA